MQDQVARTPELIPATPLWRGPDSGPAAVVLAAQDRRPHELPGAWRPLERHFQLAWCAVPSGVVGELHRIEDVLETLADRNSRAHLVADAALVDIAVRLAAEFPGTVAGLVLVGPGTGTADVEVDAALPVHRLPATGVADAAAARQVQVLLDGADRRRPAAVVVPAARVGGSAWLPAGRG
ncbi:hypothetical protein [Actinokineospora bangkokensis]|uniref:Uncharacterized protein n=1 Tax=Actinokineospora bangkokensis TaxID=1193682 RepID=A0A1Q9LQN1_9PSEU|nr:hypothetical protein [Actinokineospora bangkokensis]OLR94301.1 hypothetical protein BJP25_11035 [Actinokineospora bangkokensis]